MARKRAKYPKESALLNQRRKVRYEYLNSQGKMHGGNIYQIMDELAACIAESHAGVPALTRWDAGSFREQVTPSDTLMISGYITQAWQSSMDIAVQVYKVIRNSYGAEQLRLVAIRHYIFVALDSNGKQVEVPAVKPETAEEQERMRRAETRRQMFKIIEKLLEPPLFVSK